MGRVNPNWQSITYRSHMIFMELLNLCLENERILPESLLNIHLWCVWILPINDNNKSTEYAKVISSIEHISSNSCLCNPQNCYTTIYLKIKRGFLSSTETKQISARSCVSATNAATLLCTHRINNKCSKILNEKQYICYLFSNLRLFLCDAGHTMDYEVIGFHLIRTNWSYGGVMRIISIYIYPWERIGNKLYKFELNSGKDIIACVISFNYIGHNCRISDDIYTGESLSLSFTQEVIENSNLTLL